MNNLKTSTDISAKRHKGNPESLDANERNQYVRSTDRRMVLDLIRLCPRTMKEIAWLLGKSFNACSGRATELKRMGLVERTGERRDGSAVLRYTGDGE